MAPPEKKKKFNAILFRWHKSHFRPMAWRNTHDPYRILVSEVMLQQTQVERVQTKYAAFLKRFPNIRTLARAPLADVLTLWSGLGYNRRAKYLHECAKQVLAKHRGVFPKEFAALCALPSIGMSTAAALRAFAYGKDEPMIDTNVRRVLARVFFRGSAPQDKQLFAFAKDLISRGKGREWNYAMLDLGATMCTARNHSDKCPFVRLHGRVGDFQYKKPQRSFRGSRRFYRGKLLAALTARQRGLAISRIPSILALSKRETRAVILALRDDGLIRVAGGRVLL